MKLNKFFMLGLAGLAFAACSNNDEAEEAFLKEGKQVTVTIATGNFGTRATDAWTTDKTISVDKPKIYFLDKDENVVEVRDAKVGEETYHKVATSVTKIAATANCELTVAKGASWKEIMDHKLNVADYMVAASVPLSTDVADLLPTGGNDNGDDHSYPVYKAEITLSTPLSRIELSGNLTCTNLGTSAYEQLQLICVGVNGANTKFTLAGDGSDAVMDTNDATGFPSDAIPTQFYDEVTTPTLTTTAGVALATSYGYTIKGKPEQLLLKFDTEFKNPVTEGFIVYDPAYLKIVGFKDATTQADVTVQDGYIYQITNLEFTEEDLTSLDDQKYICVTATVNVKPWEIKAVVPEYGK